MPTAILQCFGRI